MSSSNTLAPTCVPSLTLGISNNGGSNHTDNNNECSGTNLTNTPTTVNNSSEWPALQVPRSEQILSPSKVLDDDNADYDDDDDDDWEMTEHQNTTTRIRVLHHCQSSPDFGIYETTLKNNDEAVLIESYKEEDDDKKSGERDGNEGTSITSSSMVMVSGPPSVMTESALCGASPSKISFRDIILKEKQNQHSIANKPNIKAKDQQVGKNVMKKKKPKFVVTPIKRCAKSTGDLKSLTRITEGNVETDYDCDDEEIILGETDAELFYNQKAVGRLGRTNARKLRPDEKKRLQMTMAKKDDQRQRQRATSSRKKS